MQAARLLFLLVRHLLAACGWRPSRWGREVPAQPPSASRLPKSFQWRLGLGPSNGKQISLETPRCYRGAGAWMGNCVLLWWPWAWAQFTFSSRFLRAQPSSHPASLTHQPLFVLQGHHQPAGPDSHRRHHCKPPLPTRTITPTQLSSKIAEIPQRDGPKPGMNMRLYK